ncbi:hypothetical protein [Hymenobacter fodinae]|uniref:Uncharacterized protein n=1 Tax=Hymenobacter fodinae TaxID=2510796 RepID=A0A4Z0P5D5_9BACT|nr:hypothetical protein [Hymenobacter fodinae]TGE05587.1 hypothetical protein EU556_20005 [Hymenobacter fodinae]
MIITSFKISRPAFYVRETIKDAPGEWSGIKGDYYHPAGIVGAESMMNDKYSYTRLDMCYQGVFYRYDDEVARNKAALALAANRFVKQVLQKGGVG